MLEMSNQQREIYIRHKWGYVKQCSLTAGPLSLIALYYCIRFESQ